MPHVELTEEHIAMLDALVIRRMARSRRPTMVAKWGDIRYRLNRYKENPCP